MLGVLGVLGVIGVIGVCVSVFCIDNRSSTCNVFFEPFGQTQTSSNGKGTSHLTQSQPCVEHRCEVVLACLLASVYPTHW